MTCEKIWLITDDGRPLALRRNDDGVYREPVTVKMVFIHQRHSIDLAQQNTIETIAAYHFKGKPLLILLLGIAIGIVAGGLMNIEPIISATVIATFAISTLLFQGYSASEYKIIRTVGPHGVRCIVAADEDIESLKAEHAERYIASVPPAPEMLTEKEKDQVEVQRYGLVTTLSALTLYALSGPLIRVFQGTESWITTIFTPIVALVALVIAYIGAAKTGIRMVQLTKGKAP